jgi:uncharacterized protein
MTARFIIFISTFVLILALIDLYGYFGIKQLTENFSMPWRKAARWGWFVPTIITVVLFVMMILRYEELQQSKSYTFFTIVTAFAFLFFIPKLIFIVFHFLNDLTLAGKWIVGQFSSKLESEPHERMNRFQFFNQVGLVLGTAMLGSIAYGVTKGKYAFRILSEEIKFKDLPKEFDGARVVHISDAHLGSFLDNSFDEVGEAIDMINALEPDYIFFTGDLVNNYSYEAEPWIAHFARLKAKSGKFSILGNHDYGDYVYLRDDPSHQKERAQNLERLYQIHQEMGFKLLRNENALLERNGARIRLLGMENWGVGFQQYGDFTKTLENTSEEEFKILLSHDPTHWEQQVLGKKNVHLTLSGHTHGMQFGIELPKLGVKLSPSRLRYKRWGGLYNEGEQYLYVNRGFGFLGFPGRVGMPPEITCLDLKTA